MTSPKQQLLELLATVDGISAKPSPVAGGAALFFQGKEFAHFHNDNEIDLRLTRKVISALRLSHPPGSVHHPNRSPASAWIEVRFKSRADVRRAADLVKLAAAQL